MRRSFAPIASCIFMLFCPGVIARGANAADLTTPKKAAIVFAQALIDGDFPTAKNASAGSDQDYQYLESLIQFIAASKALHNTAINKFGDAGKSIAADAAAGMTQQLNASSESIDGDKAAVGTSDGREPTLLRKIDGNWKVDLAAIPQKDEIGKALLAQKKAMLDAVADLNAGKYKTAEEAQKAIQHQIFLVIKNEIESNGGER